MIRIEESYKTGIINDWEINLHSDMKRLMETSKKKAYEIISKLGNTPIGPPYAISCSNLFDKMIAEIMHEFIGCLLRLPYFETIKRAVFKSSFKINE